MKNCQKDNGLLQAASPASPTVSPERKREPKTSAIYGLNVGECLGSYDPKLHFLKTSQASLFPTEDDFSTEFCRTFPQAGMLVNGKLYQLKKSARSMLENVYGLFAIPHNRGYFRTPDANMERGKRSYNNMKMLIKEGKPLNLNDQLNAIEKGLLSPMIGTPTASMKKRSKDFISKTLNPNEYVSLFPTPTVQDYKHRGPNSNQQGLSDIARLWPTPRANAGTGASLHGKGGLDVQSAVQVWPTPMATDGEKNSPATKQSLIHAILYGTPTVNDAKNSLTKSQKGRGTLTSDLVETGEISGGQLNADWVEALMGYPLYWTDMKKDTVNVDYPAAWLDGTWEKDIPRVVNGQQNRVKRLKCLGNAIVPQIAELIFRLPVFDGWRKTI